MENLQTEIVQIISDWLDEKGATVAAHDTPEVAALAPLLRTAEAVFPEIKEHGYIGGFVYTFPNYEPGTEITDAVTIWKEHTLGIMQAIGVSAESIRAGAEYAALLILHELCHVLRYDRVGGEHEAEFHAELDEMIERYNAATGATIVNDYAGKS